MSLPHLLRRIRSIVSGPLHRRALRQRMQLGQAPMMIPFYHRVADIHPNPWTISRQGFLRHVDYCLTHLSPCSMADVQKAVHDGRCDHPTITFTFDAGYAENMEYTLPPPKERSERVEAETDLPDEKTPSTPAVDCPITALIAPPIGLPLSNHSVSP